MDGGTGNDFVAGGAGDDTIHGYDEDTISGGEGNDLISGSGHVTMSSGDGVDEIHAERDGEDFPKVTDYVAGQDDYHFQIYDPALYSATVTLVEVANSEGGVDTLAQINGLSYLRIVGVAATDVDLTDFQPIDVSVAA